MFKITVFENNFETAPKTLSIYSVERFLDHTTKIRRVYIISRISMDDLFNKHIHKKQSAGKHMFREQADSYC